MSHEKFPSIEGFHNVRKTHLHIADPTMSSKMIYRAKIKLHGSNAGIQFRNGKIYAQSRQRYITPGDDNMGFANFVQEHDGYWGSVIEHIIHKQSQYSTLPIIIFGEWCGQGIMKGVAVSNIDRKIFAVFAIQIGHSDDDDSIVITEPDIIKQYFSKHEQVRILPWYDEEIMIDFPSPNLDPINKMVEDIEACDPWIKDEFGVEGMGEGLVFYPAGISLTRGFFSQYAFKVKGEKHKNVKTRKYVERDPLVVASVAEYVDKVVTEARLEQGVREVNRGKLEFTQKMIGPFIGWIGKDVKKETKAELEASDLEWKMVSKDVSTRARTWYLAKMMEF